MKKIFLCVHLMLSFFTFLQGQHLSPWQSLRGESFVVLYQQMDSLNAQNIYKILSEDFYSINYEIGATLEQPVRIFIAPTESGFTRMTGESFPHWGEAVAIPAHQQVIVKSPRWYRPSQQMKIILCHELVHVLVAAATANVELPRWFNEGLAIYVSGDLRFVEGKELPRAVSSGHLLKLREINSVLSFQQLQASLAYQQSFAAVQYLVDTYSHSSLPKLLQNIATYTNFQRGFYKTYGMSVLDFEEEYRTYLDDKFRYSFLLDFETWLWVIMVGLFFLAVIIRKFKNRQKIKQWEEEHRSQFTQYDSEEW